MKAAWEWPGNEARCYDDHFKNCSNLFSLSLGSHPSPSDLLLLYVPDPKEVKIVEMATTKWKRLALVLGFKLQEINSIGSGYLDPEQDCFLMLRKWLEHQHTIVPWETLITAMWNLGFTFTSLTEDLWKGMSSAMLFSNAWLVKSLNVEVVLTMYVIVYY